MKLPSAFNPSRSIAYFSLTRNPRTSQPDKENAFAQNPRKSYVLASLPLIIVILSLAFYSYLYKTGGLNAWPRIHNAVLSNPRRSAQVVAAIASFLTGVVKWGLSRAITFTAQKRFLASRSIYEAEVWTSLKNGGIIYTSFSQGCMRWMMSVLTTIVAILCGLMTSGFVTLLSPLPIPVRKQVVIAGQTDIMLSTTCQGWWERAWADASGRAGGSCENWLDYNGYKYQLCGVGEQVMDSLDAGRAAMLAHIQASSFAAPQSFLTTFPRFQGMRVLGSTGGVIPMGPAGIKPFSQLCTGSDVDDADIAAQPTENLQYTLIQQGVSTNISCQYVDPSNLPYQWPLVQGSDGLYLLNTTCPESKPRSRSIPATSNFLLVDHCLDKSGQEGTIYLQSGFRFNEVPTPGSNAAYGGVGSMSCKVQFHLSSIRSTFDPKLGGFRLAVDKVGPKESSNVLPTTIVWLPGVFSKMQTPGRNAMGTMIDTIAVSQYGLPGGVKDPRYPALVGSMLKGLLEYQLSSQRLIPLLSTLPAPEGCRVKVAGVVEYSTTGWNAQSSTIFALLPQMLISAALTYLIIQASCGDRRSKTRLKVFDPTSPVSLIATASAGGTNFDSDCIGDPEDEVVRVARVRYGEVETKRWGLIKITGEKD